MSGEQSHVTNRLAQFIAGSQWEAIPPEVRREGVRGLLNFVGCALGGAHDQAMEIAVKVLIISASSCRTRSGSRGLRCRPPAIRRS
ncbi:MAG: MmgE/PrpD family protein [Xanthobacteraceae bacterium]